MRVDWIREFNQLDAINIFGYGSGATFPLFEQRTPPICRLKKLSIFHISMAVVNEHWCTTLRFPEYSVNTKTCGIMETISG